ncbi:MAG: DUF4331 domain-containing protein [Acidimicrobiales bacterium]|jgi:hypothetical protein
MSSHREAPQISKDPVADSTDVYAFVSPDVPETVTLICNYLPLQGPDGGPNFYEFGDDVLYEINIDNDGDGVADVIYQFQFTTTLRDPSYFLYNVGPISSLSSPNWNRVQTYSLQRVDMPYGRVTVLGADLPCPPCNIGPLSTPDYAALASAAVSRVGDDILAFAGQRAEGFYVDLGAIFDLGNLRPFQGAHAGWSGTGLPAMAAGVNSTDMVNVHSLALQIPIWQLMPWQWRHNASSVIGVWTTASRQKVKIYEGQSGVISNSGPYVQVSRLGNPLFNEVLIPISLKDTWNAQSPSGDKQFAQYVSTPQLATLLPSLFPGVFPKLAAFNATNTPRADLLAILLTGIPSTVVSGFAGNFTGPTQADMLRLNMSIPPTPSDKFSNLGLIGGDVAGFPNGRRVQDDVATIELRAIAGATLPLVDPSYVPDPATGVPIAADGISMGLTSGPTDPSAMNTENYLPSFPYLGTPHGGYNAHTADAISG